MSETIIFIFVYLALTTNLSTRKSTYMKVLKWIAIVIITLILIGAIAIFALSEKQPEVNPTPEADAIAQKVLTALNKPAWDTLAFLQWEFPGGHKYIFDKKNNKALITWGSNSVDLILDDQTGTATVDGVQVEGQEKQDLLSTAWGYWCNDSFWMFAPYKLFDPNTARTIVKHEGKDALMVSYQGGGVTPGDSYLWILGDDYIPTAYKMWVSIIPIGGMEFSWENWQEMPGGAKLSTYHDSWLFPLEMKNVKEANSISGLIAH